jgi:hypothetical protein
MADEIEVEEVTPTKVPSKKKAAAAAKKATPVIEEEPVAEVVTETVTVEAETKKARVKGTWRMYFSGQVYDFTDGESYDLPPDLYNYLRGSGNIYDTLA